MTDPYSALRKDYKTIINSFIANEERKLADNPEAKDVDLFKEGNDETVKTKKG